MGSGDIESLADLGNSFEVMRTMQIAPITRDALIRLVAATLETDLEEAERHMLRLREAGIDYADAMQKLQDDGIKLFADSYDSLLGALEKKREALLTKA